MKRTLWILACLPLLACTSTKPEAAPPAVVEEASVKPGINDSFLGEEVDVDRYIGIFEGESREISVNKDAIVLELEIQPGAAMADVGAGTGLFLSAFNSAVGPYGTVYAVDLAPDFIEHMKQRVTDESLNQIRLVQCTERSVELPADSVDLVFVCDTYHHIGDRVVYFQRLKEKLRPGGRLAIVDFKKGDFPVGPRDPAKIPPEKVVAELGEAGYRLVKREDGLPYQYLLVLEPR